MTGFATEGSEVKEFAAELYSNLGEVLAGSYAEVSPDATIEEAMEAMAAKPGCQDVYVTRDGLVVGWLPNVVFIQD